MAATATAKAFQDNNQSNNGNNPEITREEIQTAIAKAVELRALHAALTQGSSPGTTNVRFPSPSPASHYSAQDYPVFTPVRMCNFTSLFLFIFNFLDYA